MIYSLLIYRTSEALSEVEERAALAGHRSVQEEASARGQLHAVARLAEPSRARTVRRTENAHDITDGPYIETKEWLVGFYLVDCATEEEALDRARAICPERGHAIEVRPVTWRWKP